MKQNNKSDLGFALCCGRLCRAIPYRAVWLAPALALVCVLAAGRATAKEKTLDWKPIDDALMRVDDAPVKDWGVYQAGKKNDRLLLQMGKRFLLIEFRDQQIYEVEPGKVQQKGAELLWNPDDRAAMPLATSDWSKTDIGGAFGISAKLDAENRVLDLQLPHPVEMGNLPQRSAAPARRAQY